MTEETHKTNSSNWEFLRKWRARLAPFFGTAIIGVFIYWLFKYWLLITNIFQKIGIWRLSILILALLMALVLSVSIFTLLVKEKGYSSFSYMDGYHSLNLSQLASIIPGGIWGFASLAAILLSKKISKIDSAFIIFTNTLIILTGCVLVAIISIVSTYGWFYGIVSLIPFLFLLLGRNLLERLSQKYLSYNITLPSTSILLKTLFLAVVVWALVSLSFAFLLYAIEDTHSIPFWSVVGAYATGYLGGFITLIAPSGIGVSEGLTAFFLNPYLDTDRVLAVAISFRIIHTFVIWSNVFLTLIITTLKPK